jgi:triosephosphate isomerase|tara:strand:+ start:16106 stop:16849 length:744 start_codon:yes stop_codon:yes gene_type:complete
MSTNHRKPIIAGNWKMNGNQFLINTFKENLKVYSDIEVVICPPSLYVHHLISENFSVGVQNISEFEAGAYTGELSAVMANEEGCRYTIIGHSERREIFDETDRLIALKTRAAIEAGLSPILCVGEPLEIREKGEVNEYIKRQLEAVLAIVGGSIFDGTIIAYEPVWAIGTGVTASPEQAQEVHAFIRAQLAILDKSASDKIRIIYGGSVTATNAQAIFNQPDIDGGLIGGASLKIDQFQQICQIARD